MVYMAILSVLTLVYTTFTARKIFFNQLDAQIMISRPVDILKIIVSKLVYLFQFFLWLNLSFLHRIILRMELW